MDRPDVPMDTVLLLHGEARHCGDCGTETVFLPVEEDCWVCTACDAAVVLSAHAPSFAA